MKPIITCSVSLANGHIDSHKRLRILAALLGACVDIPWIGPNFKSEYAYISWFSVVYTQV